MQAYVYVSTVPTAPLAKSFHNLAPQSHQIHIRHLVVLWQLISDENLMSTCDASDNGNLSNSQCPGT